MAQEVAEHSLSLRSYGRLLRDNRNFRLLWSAQVVSEIGDWLYTVAIYSLLLQLTGKAESVAIAVVLQILPQVFFAPMAGVINDRLPRRAVLIFADIVRVFIVLAMLLVRSPETVWIVWVLLFLETMMWALFEPGRAALIPNLCRGQEEITVANALSAMTWSINLTIGSGIGGLLAYAFGRETVFVLNAFSFVVSAMLLRAMTHHEPHTEGAHPLRFRDLFDYSPVWEGIRYIRQDRKMVATMLVKAGMGLLGTHWVILPVYGDRIFHLAGHGIDPARSTTLGMSLLLGSRGLGALLGSLASGWWTGGSSAKLRSGIFWGFVIMALSYVGLGFAPTLLLACLCVMAGHAGLSTCWVISTTMLQQMTDDRFRGRVFSADFAGLFLTMSGVSYAAGVLVDQGISARTIAWVTGVIGLLPAFGWMAAQRFWRVGSAAAPPPRETGTGQP